MNEVMHKCDIYLSHTAEVKFTSKLLLIEKYGLPKTKEACFNSPMFLKRTFINDLKKEPGYKDVSAELKVEMLEEAIDFLNSELYCDNCGEKYSTFCDPCEDF